ncbi:hypothetical protein DM02DRAFT_681623 [Periconia macrospinosa]|uniref:F-box domain-containing protein n=1 Tax=Periconia macrospinosa TaxID=97972 RepID=A0A2V1E7W5_9PLEO|nr:hypothetical protein DM02DRAFT_681623 [Periconia macrospinosa]
MGDPGTIPVEMARAIIENIPSSSRVSALLALSSTNSSCRNYYQPMLFKHIIARSPEQIYILAYAVTTNPSLVQYVKSAEMIVDEPFQPGSRGAELPPLHPKIFQAAKALKFWSEDWQRSLNERSVHSGCGLLLALLPGLDTLSITTRKIITCPSVSSYGNPLSDFGSKWILTRVHISTQDLFGPVAETYPDALPKLSNLKKWNSNGLMPVFAFKLSNVQSIEFSIRERELDGKFPFNDLIPSDAPAFKTIESVVIRADTLLCMSASPNRKCVQQYVRNLLQKLTKVKTLSVILWPRNFKYLPHLPYLDIGEFFGMLGGPAASLKVTIDWEGLDYYLFWTIGTNKLPQLCLTQYLELPQKLLFLKGHLTILDSPNGPSVFKVESLRITRVWIGTETQTLLSTILEYRNSMYHCLKKLHLTYNNKYRQLLEGHLPTLRRPLSDFAERERDAKIRRIHQHLCELIEGSGIQLVQDCEDSG